MKQYNNNKNIIVMFKNNKLIPILYNKQNNNNNSFSLDVPDSSDYYDDIKISLDDVIEMEVGDDLGIVAHLLPHSYTRTNPFKVSTSNKDVVSVDGMILTAKKEGTAKITATTMNNEYSDTITINVSNPVEFTANENETYIVEPNRFNLVDNDFTQEQAWINSNAIKSIIRYAKEKNYKKILFPENNVYYYDPANPIYMRNNLIIDLNGSTLQVYPNYLYTYNGVYMFESDKEFNICPHGWVGLTDSGYGSYITDYSPNENNVMTYWKNELTSDYIYDLNLTSGGELGEYYVNGNISVVDSFSFDDENQYTNFIIKNKSYTGYFNFIKYRTYDNIDADYTDNVVKLSMECYKNDVLIDTMDLVNYPWNKRINGREIKFTLNITSDYDYIKLKASGLSDQNLPVSAFLYDVKIYETRTPETYAENIIIENGHLLGDRYIEDTDGNNIKENLFLEKYGKNWTAISKTEGCQNLDIEYGYNIGCRNMTIGDSIGFNIAIGNGKQSNAYYPNVNLFENGTFDNNGNKIDKDNYARLSAPVEVSIENTPYFMITDPTFIVTYYYGFTSRLVDVYCYDENMNLLKELKGKFRHGLLKAPEGTKYMSLAVPLREGESIPTNGHGDFSNSVMAIKFMYPTQKCFIKDCKIRNNYSCGIAHSGNGVLIENCHFYNNIGRMPWCDIDSEDGWVRMQNNVFRNNTFESYYGVIMCSGTNYVFKNNTFNCPFIQYADTQYFKLYGNTFKNNGYIGASKLGTMADSYIIKNTFEDMPINTEKNHSELNYKNYFFNNTLNNSYLSLTNDTVCGNNILVGNLELRIYNPYLFENKTLLKTTSSITITDSMTFNNCNFGQVSLKIKSGKTITFNNCIFEVLPSEIQGTIIGNCIFNNCKITNAKKSNSFTYNNCTFIDGIIDKYILDGLDRDELIFTQQDASGTYYAMQNNNIKTFNNWTIFTLLKKSKNYAFNMISGDKLLLMSAANKNSVSVQIYYTNNNGETNTRHMWTATGNDVVGDSELFILSATYDSENKKYSMYINNNLIYSYSIPTGYEPSPITNDISIGGNCSAKYYYVWNKLMTDEQLNKTYEILKSTICNFNVESSISINEGENYRLNISLDNAPKDDVEIVSISCDNYNIDLDTKTLIFTKDTYNIPQTVNLYGNYDSISASNKNTKITLSSNNIQTKNINIDIINTNASYNQLEESIKEQYPQCTNFKGSWDFNNLTSTFFNDCTEGDFWINDKATSFHVYHERIHYPNDIIYYDGENVQPLRRNKFIDTTVQEQYDVCIVGGGAGGIACAYALKDKGYKVCLIEKLSELGGTHIHASIPVLISTPITGTWFKNIIEDAYNLGMVDINMFGSNKNGIGDGSDFDKKWRASLFCNHCSERGIQWNVSMNWFSNRYYQDLHNSIDIKFRTEFIDNIIEDNKITSIKVKSLDSNTEYYINAKYFVDASADGVLCRSNKTLNEDYYIGTDGRNRFNELAYAEDAEPDIYAINTVEAGYKIFFESEHFASDKTNHISIDVPNVDDYPNVTNGSNGSTTDPQLPFIQSTSTSAHNAVDPHIFIDNGNDYALEHSYNSTLVHRYLYAPNWKYLEQNKMLGIRESYRIKCDRMLTQTDCEKLITLNDIQKDHIIALSTWYADLHNAIVKINNSGFNGIPYESLIPTAFTNVLIASRCYGCSHLAQSSFRLTKTMMSLGYAAGNALSQCVSNNLTDVRNIDIIQLQNDIDITSLFNEVNKYIKL